VEASSIDFSGASTEFGLIILLVAQLLSSFMGVYVQDMYAEHGKHWDENLFYSHFISLPLFFPLAGTLRTQFQRLQNSPPMVIPDTIANAAPLALQEGLAKVPRSLFMLGLNSLAQLLCITGVNLLGAKSSAVTVTIVLNVRKLVSWILSIWLFGNPLSGKMVLGAALVFGSGALYGWETTVGIKSRQKKEKQGRVENGSANGAKEL
jgi:UDP-galactose transporter